MSIEKEQINEAYEDVRDDNTSTTWLVCKFEGSTIVLGDTGESYDELLKHFGEDDRVFAFVRVIMGDELSKRAKFAFITWMGSNVGSIQKAKASTEKPKVKSIIKSFAAEIMAEDLEQVQLDVVKDTLTKAGGANYGTGKRD